jgi:hypothetical protein
MLRQIQIKPVEMKPIEPFIDFGTVMEIHVPHPT